MVHDAVALVACWVFGLTLFFIYLRGVAAHLEWTRCVCLSYFFDTICFIVSSCMLLIGRPSPDEEMRLVQMQHFCSWRGIQMKSEEPHFKFGVGHENDLQIHATCYHACWCDWICEMLSFFEVPQFKSMNVQLPCILTGRV